MKYTAEGLTDKHLGAGLDKPEFWEKTVGDGSGRVDEFERLVKTEVE